MYEEYVKQRKKFIYKNVSVEGDNNNDVEDNNNDVN